jgi:nucleotide-binding universal stress UspA family protein
VSPRRRPSTRLLLATDFSRSAARAEAEATRLVRSLDAEILVLHVVPPLQMFGGGRVKIADMLAVEQARLAAAAGAVRKRAAALRSRGLRASGVVRSGPVARQIVATASRRACAMIVIATRGRGLLARRLLGSTAERVIRLARCPVLTVRA